MTVLTIRSSPSGAVSAPACPVEPEIVLDLSRLLSRILHRTPTGVDRVEMAYAEQLMRIAPERLRFGAVHPTGLYGRIPPATAAAFLAEIRAGWSGVERAAVPRATVARLLWTMRPRPLPRPGARRVFLQSSPHHLHDERLVRGILLRENAGLVCLLHDLIPIEYPEYARPGGGALHRRRIMTVARLADAAIANSEATRRAFLPYPRAAGREIDVHVAHLGLDAPRRAVTPATADRPYFLCLGTIEPRKNHLLLLNIWRAMAAAAGPEAVPKLVIVGRRGWENEQVIDMLDRCPALRDTVEEHAGLPDDRMRAMMAGARALLMPSFAEGYGMPVTEALALGVPVLCGDIPAMREAGGEAPDYLDPLDGLGWRQAILDYAAPASPRRARQVARIADWTAPTWADHIDIVLRAIEGLER